MKNSVLGKQRRNKNVIALKEDDGCWLQESWRETNGEFWFWHLIHSLTLVQTRQRRNHWSVSEFSWERERKEREREQCKWPQKRESHVCDQMSPNVMGQSRERISDIRKDIRPDNRSDKIIIYSDQFSGLILHFPYPPEFSTCKVTLDPK